MFNKKRTKDNLFLIKLICLSWCNTHSSAAGFLVVNQGDDISLKEDHDIEISFLEEHSLFISDFKERSERMLLEFINKIENTINSNKKRNVYCHN